jgi:hypothetical protein
MTFRIQQQCWFENFRSSYHHSGRRVED